MRAHASSGVPNFLPEPGSAVVSFVISPRLERGSRWRVRHPFLIHSIYHSTVAARSDRVVLHGARRRKLAWSLKEGPFVPSLIDAPSISLHMRAGQRTLSELLRPRGGGAGGNWKKANNFKHKVLERWGRQAYPPSVFPTD